MLYSWSVEGDSPSLPSEQFSDVINAQVLACDCYVDENLSEGEFETQVEKASLGSVSIFRYSSWGVHTANRTSDHVRKDQTDDILLYVPLTAKYRVRQGDRDINLLPGMATFVRMDKPLLGTFIGEARHPVTGANVRLPLSLVRERLPRIDECIHDVIPLGPGAGRLMLSLLESAFEEARHLDDRSVSLIGEAVLDSICAVGHSRLSQKKYLGVPQHISARSLTRQRVEEFVLSNLARPELGPSMIAARCNISLRCLHLSFEGTGWTVSSWIKEQRLQRCRRELQDPELAYRSVGEIAYAWGFKDVSHFSRAYKARFNVPPSLDRPGAGAH